MLIYALFSGIRSIVFTYQSSKSRLSCYVKDAIYCEVDVNYTFIQKSKLSGSINLASIGPLILVYCYKVPQDKHNS